MCVCCALFLGTYVSRAKDFNLKNLDGGLVTAIRSANPFETSFQFVYTAIKKRLFCIHPVSKTPETIRINPDYERFIKTFLFQYFTLT